MSEGATTDFVHANGLRFSTRSWGQRPPRVVLAHGLASSSAIWTEVAPRLAPNGGALALDQRGHGRTDKPDEGFDFATIVRDLHAVVEDAGSGQVVLVGHSWGGNVALQFAATHPERVAGLVLVDGGFIELAAIPGRTWDQVEVDMAPPDLTSYTMDGLLERVRNGDSGRLGYWGPAVEATIRGCFREEADGTVRPNLSRQNHLKILRAMWEQRPRELFSRITCPTTIVAARRSDATGRAAAMRPHREAAVERAAAAIPRARLVWMEETVHDIPLHRPNELAALILEHLA
ncbi:MAG: alpha/beta hydrolase [Chloroflexota bacterium]